MSNLDEVSDLSDMTPVPPPQGGPEISARVTKREIDTKRKRDTIPDIDANSPKLYHNKTLQEAGEAATPGRKGIIESEISHSTYAENPIRNTSMVIVPCEYRMRNPTRRRKNKDYDLS